MHETQRSRARGKGLPILLGCFLALIVIMLWEAAESHAGYTWDLETDSATGQVHRVKIRDGKWRLKVELKGDLEISADERGVERLGPNSYLIIDERKDKQRRRLEVKPGVGGQPEIAWSVNRESAAFDDAGRDWLAEILPRVYRVTGLDAAGRVDRLLGAGGLDAVLREIEKIRGDSVQRLYFEQLMAQVEMTTDDLERVLRQMGREIGSDHELSQLLATVPTASLVEEKTANAFIMAAGTLGSDYELRQVLISFLERPDFDPATAEALLDVAGTVGGDYDLAEVLTRLVDAVPAESRLPVAFSRVLESIGSDYELNRVLTKALARPNLTPEELDELLGAARGISSDYELAELLTALAGSYPGELPGSYFKILGTIGGDFNLRRTLAAVAARPRLTPREVEEMLESALGIGSDHEMSQFLIELVGVYPIDANLRSAFDRAAATIGSEHQRQQVEDAEQGKTAG